jgi:PAS domain S-box-containing protein
MALLPAFGLFAWRAAHNQQGALQLAQSSLQSEAMLMAASQQALVDAAQQMLGDIANSPVLQVGEPTSCSDYLRSLQTLQPAYAELGVAGLDGLLLCHSQVARVGAPAGDDGLLKSTMAQRQFVIGRYGVAGNSGKSGLGFALPVYDKAQTLSAVVFTVVDVHAFRAALASVTVAPQTRAILTDRKGIVLADYPAGIAPAGSVPAPDAPEQLHLHASVSVPGAAREALFVTASLPRALISDTSRQVLLFELALLLATAAVGMACAWWMGKRLVIQPAQAILREANELALGNLAARVEVGPSYSGELGNLALTFNRMAESLQVRREELDDALARVGREHRLLDLIVNSMSEGVIAADAEGRFLLFNAAARKLFPGDEAPGSLATWRQRHELATLDGRLLDAREDKPLSRAIRGESLDGWDLVLRIPDTKDRVLRMNTRPLRSETGQLVGGLVVFTDITERKLAEDFSRGQEQVLELIAGGSSLPAALDAIVRLIESRAPDGLCAISLLEGGQLRHGAGPSLPDSINQQVDGLVIGEGAGACGTAAFRKKPVVVTDVAADPLMQDYLAVLRESGLRACWSTPVLSTQGAVLATFAIYHRAPHLPQPQEFEFIETAVRLARIAIERARSEEALLGSEARFRELAENVEDVFYNRDFVSGRFLYISPAYEMLWGRRREGLYAQPQSYRDAIHPEDRLLEASAKQGQARGEITKLEYRIVRAGGETRWIRDHSYPVMNAAGAVERIVGTARDITDRKLADLELARTNRALQMLSRCNAALTRMDDETELLMQVCRLAVDVGGYRLAWVGYAQDDEARSILPMARAGHDAGYLSSIVLTWDGEQLTGRGPAGQTIRSGEVRVSEDITRGDNQFYWSEKALQQGYRSAVFLPLRDASRTFGLLGLYSAAVEKLAPEEVKLLQELADNLAFGIGNLRSRLERKQAQGEILRLNAELEERVRQRTAQLETANQELEAFSYSVSHDLRTPLSAIDGFSGLLAKDISAGGMTSARGQHYLTRIRAGVGQMGELINALLSLAQVSKTSLRWGSVNLSATAQEVLNGYHEREPGRRVQFQVAPDVLVQGDARLLQQVLDNLLGNAWKFSAGQPQTRIIFGREQGSDGQDVYVVRDNGAGFDMAYSEKLFGAFQRLHTVAEFEGTGIGLATVHRIVTRHGGKVWAESAPGQGATFYFTLGGPRI